MRGERRCGGGGGGGSASTNGGPRSAELLFQPLCTHRVFGVYGVARDGDTHGRARRTTPHRLAHRTVSRIAPFARYARTEAPSIAARARAHRPHSRPSRVDACLARRAADASSATHAHDRAPSPLRARTHHTTHRRRRHRRRRPQSRTQVVAQKAHHPPRELVHRRRRRRRSRQRRSRRRRSPRHRARSTARASRSRAAADAAAEPTTRAPTLSTSGEPHARRRRRRSSRHRRGGVVERARAMRA